MKIISFIKRKIGKQKPRLKQRLQISQHDGTLHIAGSLSDNDFHVSQLWLSSRENEDTFLVENIAGEPDKHFQFEVCLEEIAEKLSKAVEGSFDWYIKVSTPYNHLNEAKNEDHNVCLLEKNGQMYASYFMRLGGFQFSNIDRLDFYHHDGHSLINYITTKGSISLAWDMEPDSPTKIQIDKVKRDHTVFGIEGKLFTRNSIINHARLILRGRDSQLALSSDAVVIEPMKDIPRKYGLHRYFYKATFDMATINTMQKSEHDVYDLFFAFDMHDSHELKLVRIGRPTARARFFIKDVYAKGKENAAVINPYYTFKASNLSFESYLFPVDTYDYLRKMMRWAWFIRLVHRKNNVWIIGERSYKAQDTGLAFFKYVRENHPDLQAFYVIDKDSPERRNVDALGNVLLFGSKAHIKHAIIAKKIISSHHPDYLYPIRTPAFQAKSKADKVFLQHGVMGTKNMVANYGKEALGFDTDLFMVSSPFEKQMIINDFGYNPDEVYVTGLSRFDTLFENDVPLKRQVLIIPTWRDWIITDEQLLESDYYARYTALINSPKLHQLAEEQDFNILFCLHPNMQRFSRHFENEAVQVIIQGEVEVQYLIKESALMITDYSSVGFDFSFLHKPIIYYQFDRDRFIGSNGSHLDLDNDLPGDICTQQDDILTMLEQYAANDFQMKPSYQIRADKFISHKDQQSSQRIFDVIENTTVSHPMFDHPKLVLLKKGISIKFRKSAVYFPAMKLFYHIGRKIIPVDERLILFESGVGKQVSDSPRKIYDEIIAQGLDYKKVWVYNRPQSFTDENTIKIKRLSPIYYYYLLKARYWVNNQNFPTYIQKRPETTYLQTWHGTPLKKMLYDIKEVHGRKDDYVERVGKAVENWDYLISPSSYATQAFRSAFHYNGEVLETGYPRNDIFYQDGQETAANRIRQRLGITKAKKVILYAPTFRDDQTSKANKFSFDMQMDLQEMQQRLGEEYIILLRMHVVIQSKLQLDESLQDFVWDVSSYPDMQDLLLISDVLITDYSSVMFDFANTGKPIVFFAYDLAHYRDDLRGFYFDFENEAPGPFVYNTAEIIENILHLQQVKDQYREKYQQFVRKFCELEDGNAAKRIVDDIFK